MVTQGESGVADWKLADRVTLGEGGGNPMS